jgi:CheY-like chemotaxis protein
MRILVIEDEKKTAAFLAKGLCEAGFAVDLAQDGQTDLELARTTKSDLPRYHAANQRRLARGRRTSPRYSAVASTTLLGIPMK